MSARSNVISLKCNSSLNKSCSKIFPVNDLNQRLTAINMKFWLMYTTFCFSVFIPGSDCSRNFTSPSGLVESPGFPDKYPHNLECAFIIIVPPRMDVTLTFLTFDLENDPLPGGDGDCKYDWLEVWDGLPGGTTFMLRICRIEWSLRYCHGCHKCWWRCQTISQPCHESVQRAKWVIYALCPAYIIIDRGGVAAILEAMRW